MAVNSKKTDAFIKNKRKKLTGKEIAPYIFVLPFVLSFLFFMLYPLVHAFLLGFQQLIPFTTYTEWVGLENFQRVMNDPSFFIALWNVARYTFWTCIILIPLPMLLSFIINGEKIKFKAVFRSTYFVPVLTSSVIAGIIFGQVFSAESGGAFNQLLGLFGADPIRWLNSASTGMFALVLIAVWRWIGVNMIYFLSGLSGISNELYESAEIDGASNWKKFRFITVPMLRPITIFVLTISITAGFSLFNESFVYWGVSSPNNIGATLVILIYRAGFLLNDFGYAAALGVSLFLIVLVVNVVQLKIMGLFKED